jgi:hypothetical protein
VGYGLLGRQDSYVLDAVHVLLGGIDRCVLAVTMHVGDDTDGLRFRFWAVGHPVEIAEVADDIDEALFCLDALLNPDFALPLHQELLTGPPPPDIDRWAGRLLYLTPDLAAAMPHLVPTSPVTDSPPPDPAMTPLDRENLYTLHAHQASLGHITPTLYVLALHTSDTELRLRAWTTDHDHDTAALARIAERLHHLLPPAHPPIRAEILPGSPPSDRRRNQRGRVIYCDKRRPGRDTYPKPLPDRVVDLLHTIAAHLPDEVRHPLRAQLDTATGTGETPGQTIHFKIPPQAPPTPLPDGPLALPALVVDASGTPIGEILLWIRDGYLSTVERAWFTGDTPDTWPDAAELDIPDPPGHPNPPDRGA